MLCLPHLFLTSVHQSSPLQKISANSSLPTEKCPFHLVDINNLTQLSQISTISHWTLYCLAIEINVQILHWCLHNPPQHFLSLECRLPLPTEKLIVSLLFMTQITFSSINPKFSLLIMTIPHFYHRLQSP